LDAAEVEIQSIVRPDARPAAFFYLCENNPSRDPFAHDPRRRPHPMTTPRPVRRSVRSARKLFAAFCALAFVHQAASAQVVSNTADSGAGSLRSAVGASTGVTWTGGGAGTITLLSGLGIGAGTTLDTSGAGSAVTINGDALSLSGATTFQTNAASPFSIVSNIGGAGSVVVAETTAGGVVSLSGVNTYTGGTTINSGVLNVNSDSALGATTGGITFNGAGTLQAGASITSARTVLLNANGTFDTNGFTSALTGVVSGVGQLIVADGSVGGGGILDLQNTGNTYSGGTLFQSGTLSINNDAVLGTGSLTFNGGTLQTGVSLTDSRSITLESLGGTFDTAGTTSTLAGLISGTGALTKISSGTLVLTGANTYTGGTVINGGVLQVSSESNLGGTAGPLTLNGGTLQTAGALTDSRAVLLGSNGGTIDTDGNNDVFSGVFTSTVAGEGSLTKIGAGILTLSGLNTYQGGTNVNVGTLQMGANNVMPTGRNLSIAGGATFNMNGFSQTNALGAVTNNGLLNVGSGSLNVGGYSGSGTMAVTLGTANLATGSNTPSVTSAGNINISNGTVSLGLIDPGVKNGDVFNVIQANTLTTNASTQILSTAAVELQKNLTATGLTVTAELTPFATLATTSNQAAVAGALETLRTQAQSNPNSQAGTVMNELYALNNAQIQTAFDQIGPIAYAGLSSLGFSGSSVEAEALGRRMTELDSGASTGGVTLNTGNGKSVDLGSLLAEGGTDDQDPFGRHLQPDKDVADSGFGFFGSLVGTSGHQQSVNGSAGFEPGYDYRSGGVLLGGDYRVNDALAVGLAGGYLYGHSNVFTNALSSLDDDTGRAGVYAAIHEGAFRADLYAGGALDYYSTNRGIAIVGSPSQTATANPNGDELNANGYFTYDVETKNYGTLSPFLGINEDRLMVRSFSESGAPGLNLDVGPQTAQSLRSSLGLRQSTKSVNEGVTIDAHWSLGWVHEFSDQSRPIDAQLAAGGSSFSVQTASLPSDGALAGAGIVVSVDKDTSVNVDYSLDVRDRFQENTLQAALHLLF
jgi:autotransporter-associated beta strand protein